MNPVDSAFEAFEIDLDPGDSRADQVNRVRWIILLRYLVAPAVLALMFFTGWQGWTAQASITLSSLAAMAVTGLIATALNTAYWWALRRDIDLDAFVFAQLLVDIVLFASYVYRSGGVTSPFTFLYLLPIIAAAILISGRMAFVLAGLAALSWSLIAFLPMFGVLEHVSYFVALDRFAHKGPYVMLLVVTNSFAFLTVAFISSALMRNVREKSEALRRATRQLDRKAILLSMLYVVARGAAELSTPREVLGHIGRTLVDGLALDRVLIYLVEPADGGGDDGKRLVLGHQFHHSRLDGQPTANLEVEIPLTEDAGMTARAALSHIAVNVNDPLNHPEINTELAARIGLNPFALAPLVGKGELLGVIGVDRSEEFGVIEDDEFAVLVAFADNAAAVLHAAQEGDAAAQPLLSSPPSGAA